MLSFWVWNRKVFLFIWPTWVHTEILTIKIRDFFGQWIRKNMKLNCIIFGSVFAVNLDRKTANSFLRNKRSNAGSWIFEEFKEGINLESSLWKLYFYNGWLRRKCFWGPEPKKFCICHLKELQKCCRLVVILGAYGHVGAWESSFKSAHERSNKNGEPPGGAICDLNVRYWYQNDQWMSLQRLFGASKQYRKYFRLSAKNRFSIFHPYLKSHLRSKMHLNVRRLKSIR